MSIVDKVVLIKTRSLKVNHIRHGNGQDLTRGWKGPPQQVFHASRPVVRDTVVIFRLPFWESDRLSLRDERKYRKDYIWGKLRIS
jgi:hypothetical protein